MWKKCILLTIVVFVIPWTGGKKNGKGDKPTLLICSLPSLLERNHQTVKVAFSNCPKLDTTCQHDLWCLKEITKEIHLRNNYPMFAYWYPETCLFVFFTFWLHIQHLRVNKFTLDILFFWLLTKLIACNLDCMFFFVNKEWRLAVKHMAAIMDLWHNALHLQGHIWNRRQCAGCVAVVSKDCLELILLWKSANCSSRHAFSPDSHARTTPSLSQPRTTITLTEQAGCRSSARWEALQNKSVSKPICSPAPCCVTSIY